MFPKVHIKEANPQYSGMKRQGSTLSNRITVLTTQALGILSAPSVTGRHTMGKASLLNKLSPDPECAGSSILDSLAFRTSKNKCLIYNLHSVR